MYRNSKETHELRVIFRLILDVVGIDRVDLNLGGDLEAFKLLHERECLLERCSEGPGKFSMLAINIRLRYLNKTSSLINRI